jgi:hypothetical protein
MPSLDPHPSPPHCPGPPRRHHPHAVIRLSLSHPPRPFAFCAIDPRKTDTVALTSDVSPRDCDCLDYERVQDVPYLDIDVRSIRAAAPLLILHNDRGREIRTARPFYEKDYGKVTRSSQTEYSDSIRHEKIPSIMELISLSTSAQIPL